MSKKKIEVLKEIKSIEQWEEVLEKSKHGPMAIIDVYLERCGPCQPIVPNYTTLWFIYDDPESRISFY